MINIMLLKKNLFFFNGGESNLVWWKTLKFESDLNLMNLQKNSVLDCRKRAMLERFFCLMNVVAVLFGGKFKKL